MAGNTNPNQAFDVQNLVGHFTSLDDTAINYLETLFPAVSKVGWVTDTQAVLVEEKAGLTFLPLELILIAREDLSALAGFQFSLDSQVDSQNFNWSDYTPILTADGKIVRIMLDGGLNDMVIPSGSNLTLTSEVGSPAKVVNVITVGVWILGQN